MYFHRHGGFRLAFLTCDAVLCTARLTRFVRWDVFCVDVQVAVQVRRSCQKDFELHIVRLPVMAVSSNNSWVDSYLEALVR